MKLFKLFLLFCFAFFNLCSFGQDKYERELEVGEEIEIKLTSQVDFAPQRNFKDLPIKKNAYDYLSQVMISGYHNYPVLHSSGMAKSTAIVLVLKSSSEKKQAIHKDETYKLRKLDSSLVSAKHPVVKKIFDPYTILNGDNIVVLKNTDSESKLEYVIIAHTHGKDLRYLTSLNLVIEKREAPMEILNPTKNTFEVEEEVEVIE